MQSDTLGVKQYSSAPAQFLVEGNTYIVTLATSKGDIKIQLFNDEVPVAANNFAFLAKDGFYNGTIFHRVIKDFMIQGGDPLGTGMGGPGYSFVDEPVTRSYNRGVIAYANSGANTNGSQFFIMHQDYPLPPQYVIFGEVIEGLEIVDAIAESPVKINEFGSEVSTPVDEIVISSATLSEE
ncbi:peptidylprolyl isomerase [candidate division WWE3 bacterium CG_4_10_14_0_2_um_filter_41_14]|uniref:Peptidyl-prolyl cis-trans isomerase n=1 Tax=candidate division WWE3 bacterium CG_4_10_14_0_2_um_filter_41_14 TaxID=1975072 RepID=A0A2M7THB4_UNCKA|nr:MAG: peptidylprolyl isomerase [candidate division WWE3 bacterium CG_4_10_14_0_2_um_filter_41_14]